jgi:hypothetical protein
VSISAVGSEAQPLPAGGHRTDVLSRRGSDVLLAVAMLALGAAFLAYLPSAFSVDTWLGLVGGRDVWNHGIPHIETLTALAHGTHWVDQQWLSEIATYGLYLAGGFALLGVANVGLIVAGVGGAIAAARKLGASPRAVMLALPVCVWLMIPSREVRTQEFAIPLFVAIVYLLAKDCRTPSKAVYWTLPILALWGNLHGTVTLGVGLVCLRGLTMLWDRRSVLLREPGQWVRPLALVVGAPLCLLLTPYGFSALGYYDTMFLHSTVRDAVTEWQPITTEATMAVPFFAGAAALIWLFGRHPSRTTLWDKLAILALAAGSIMVIRNVLFFALCALVVAPLALTAPAGETVDESPNRVRGRINGVLLAAAVGAAVISIAATFARPSSTFELSYQRLGVLTAVERAEATDPSLKVLADVRFADWLLWRDPALRGKVANDAQFEVLTAGEVSKLESVMGAIGPDWKAGARGYGLIVLDSHFEDGAVKGFEREPGARVLYNDGERVVILRSTSASSA